MLLTITYLGEHTSDIGYLFCKNPSSFNTFDIPFGKAYQFFPEVTESKTTLALYLDINSLDIVKGKQNDSSQNYTLFDYINDRPFTTNSFISSALLKIFKDAMNGKCKGKPDMVEKKLHLITNIYNMRAKFKNESTINELFEPLGYKVSYTNSILNPNFEEFGTSPYIDLTLDGEVKLMDLLNQLYIFIQVFDHNKHYNADRTEFDKLIKHSESWLSTHPKKDLIINRFFNKKKELATKAKDYFTKLEEAETTAEDSNASSSNEKTVKLNELRMNAVKDAVLQSQSKTVLDLGCNNGNLIKHLIQDPSITKIDGADVYTKALESIKINIDYWSLSEEEKNKLSIYHGSLIYKDERYKTYDCICIVEVIEHLDKFRFPYFENVIFKYANPKTIIITTPNIEYNVKYDMEKDSLRHKDHKFEWNREEFKQWCEHITSTYNYDYKISYIGDNDSTVGSPTQMVVFTKIGKKED